MKPAPLSMTAVASICLGLLLVACQTSWEATPFPPDLTYLPPERIRTSMWVLAAEVKELEELLSTPRESDSPTLKFQVLGILERMQVAARALDEPGRSTQHPILNENLGRFLHRLETAKRAVDRDPPIYFQASTIAGSCFLCHGRTQNAAAPRMPSSDPGARGGG